MSWSLTGQSVGAAVAALAIGAGVGAFTVGGMTPPAPAIPYTRFQPVEPMMANSTVPISIDPVYRRAERFPAAYEAPPVRPRSDCVDLAGYDVDCETGAVPEAGRIDEAARTAAAAAAAIDEVALMAEREAPEPLEYQ